jgi:ABC-type dipeptide/oligopeptide/nickel transport system ATPase subunit
MIALNPSTSKKSPLHEILNWSTSRPEWQRDALRRIIEKGQPDAADIAELERISRSSIKHASIKPTPLKAIPLSSAHLPSAPGAADSVSLVSLSALKGINQLPQGSDLPLGTGDGLTIIFGMNGVGKSSYARVIKKACRARGSAAEILPNAFAPVTTTVPAAATITFKVGSNQVASSWKSGVPTDPRLANVFVFDASSADHYVSYDSEAAFTPYGLDVLPTLSTVCDNLASRLNAEINQWDAKITGAKANWKYDPATKVGQALQNLSKATKESDISALAALDQAEMQRLLDLRAALKADPLQKAKETRAAASRLEAFAKKIGNAAVDLADEKIEQVRTELEAAKNTAATAKAFATGQFDSTYLTGTGSDIWRALWDAAKRYSESEAYPDSEFPFISDDARCVLCQQVIDGATGARFSHFNDFCKDQSQQLAAAAEQLLLKTIARFNLLIALRPELDKIDADLAILPANERLLLSAFADSADARLKQVKESLLNRSWTAPPAISVSPEAYLQTAMSTLEARAKTEESAHDPETRKKLQAELKELEAREWLAGVKADVLQQIDHYKIISELKDCDKDLKTSAITAKSTELTELFVTQAFQQRFKDEVAGLKLHTLEVVMDQTHGKKGISKFGLRLVKAANSKVADIASEGERRCVALAAFLSELSQASHQSALVFDDPVSSLDHSYRERIAERLATESKSRQVIVFTHEEVFLNDLISFAENAQMTPFILTLDWDNNAPGKYFEGLPWDSKKPPELLDALEKEQKAIAAKWNSLPSAQNIADMRRAYSRLRSTMERIIEVELLSGIVCRFQSQINSGRVNSLIGIDPQECKEVKRLLDKCHSLTEAHAPSKASIPTPSDLKQDIADARKLVDAIKTRKKTQGSAGTA